MKHASIALALWTASLLRAGVARLAVIGAMLMLAGSALALAAAAALLGAFQRSISSAATPLAGKVVLLGTLRWLGFMLLVSALPLLLTLLSAKQAPASLNALAGQ